MQNGTEMIIEKEDKTIEYDDLYKKNKHERTYRCSLPCAQSA